MSVVVKGNRFEAARAAADRGIPFAFKTEIRDGVETVGFVSDEFEIELSRWLAEPPVRAPFPVGAVLLFTNAPGPLRMSARWPVRGPWRA